MIEIDQIDFVVGEVFFFFEEEEEFQ